MQSPDEVAIDGGALLPGQIQPVQRGISFAVFDPADGPRRLRSMSIATTSSRIGREVRSVSKNVPLSALHYRTLF